MRHMPAVAPSPVPPSSRTSELVARPLEALVTGAGGQDLPGEAKAGLESVTSLLAVVEGQARAAELRAVAADQAANSTRERTFQLEAALTQVVHDEVVRNSSLGGLIGTALADGSDPSPD